ncbi:KdsC family phosphatase [Ectobacillus antri]|uniref:KdsC family phosphatase n=1 Tax=Ectobacillus antri TaxID=2486280 RepID=UPI000F5A1831|nr:HAD-IIIA family hydrolase [Ectobacillus antri]
MKPIKLIVLDVDGVLTDGKLYIGSDGNEIKAFHTQDGMGISLARHVGIKLAIISGRSSAAVTKRAAELKFDHVYQGIHEKVDVLYDIMSEHGVTLEEVCYVGDDINDLPILQIVGFAAAPNNAVELVKEHVDFIAKANGGEGAVREIIEHILKQTYNYNEVLFEFLNGKVKITQ